MKTSERGIALICEFEGFVGHAYNDPDGNCTVGYGHLLTYRRCTQDQLRKWERTSEKEARDLLGRDLRSRENAVERHVTAPATQSQKDAFVSLIYNIGQGAFAESTALRQFNKKHYRRAAAAFLLWVRGSTGELPGLVRRRRAEIKLFKREGWHP